MAIGGSGGPSAREMWRILLLAFRVRAEPLPYARAAADLVPRYLRSRGVRPTGSWLDVGCGGGALAPAMVEAGAERVVALDVADRRLPALRGNAFALGSATALPFPDAAFDGVLCSNVLEHVADHAGMVRELLRVCRPGGTVYLSWTNWYSPLGGHEWSPLHYLGARLGPRVYALLRGRAPAWNLPGRTLFAAHVGSVLRLVRSTGAAVVDVAPRYWPGLRWIARVPGLREVAMWNCVILLRPSA